MQLYSLPQAAEVLGQTYDRVYYAIATKKIQPKQAGRARLLTEADLDELRKLFDERDQDANAVRKAQGRKR